MFVSLLGGEIFPKLGKRKKLSSGLKSIESNPPPTSVLIRVNPCSTKNPNLKGIKLKPNFSRLRRQIGMPYYTFCLDRLFSVQNKSPVQIVEEDGYPS